MANSNEKKISKWWLGIVFAPMALLLSFVAYANGVATSANATAQNACHQVDKMAAELSIHEARQNGSLEAIQSQLSTLRTYHSTLRGEMKEQRKLLDELLRHSYSEHSAAP